MSSLNSSSQHGPSPSQIIRKDAEQSEVMLAPSLKKSGLDWLLRSRILDLGWGWGLETRWISLRLLKWVIFLTEINPPNAAQIIIRAKQPTIIEFHRSRCVWQGVQTLFFMIFQRWWSQSSSQMTFSHDPYRFPIFCMHYIARSHAFHVRAIYRFKPIVSQDVAQGSVVFSDPDLIKPLKIIMIDS